MTMIVRFPFVRRLPPLLALCLLSGCGAMETVQNLVPHHNVNDEQLNLGANPRKTAGSPPSNPSERPKVLAVASQDINCPPVDVAEDGAALRVGGPDNPSVRYQFNIGDTARQCDPAGPGQVAIKIGVKGDVVVGQAGSAGTLSAPLRIEIINTADKKPVFSKIYNVSVTTDGILPGIFQVVTDPIVVPMPTLQLPNVYEISVGFGSGGGAAKKPQRRRRAG